VIKVVLGHTYLGTLVAPRSPRHRTSETYVFHPEKQQKPRLTPSEGRCLQTGTRRQKSADK